MRYFRLNTTVGNFNNGDKVNEDEISELLNVQQCIDCGWLTPWKDDRTQFEKIAEVPVIRQWFCVLFSFLFSYMGFGCYIQPRSFIYAVEQPDPVFTFWFKLWAWPATVFTFICVLVCGYIIGDRVVYDAIVRRISKLTKKKKVNLNKK
jgi:hypothetical protein